MKNLFNLDNPVFRFLARITDMVLLQFMFLLFSLPLVTIGASMTAMAKITQTMIRSEDSGVVKPFIAAFRANFRQATPVWLFGFLALAGILSDFLLLKTYITGTLYSVLGAILLIFLLVVLGILSYMFPLIARYENTVRQHLQNAMVLFLYKLPRTILLVLLDLFPLLLAWFFPSVLVYTMVFWVFAGFSILSFMQSMVLKPVFDQLEKD